MNKLRKDILFIMDGVSIANKKRGGQGLTGGIIRAIDIAKELKKFRYNVNILTSKAGKEVCKKLGLNANYYITRYPLYFSLFNAIKGVITSIHLPEELRGYKGIVYSTSEHVYNVIPAVRLERRNGNKIVVVAHWVAPIKRKGTSILHGILYYINQRLGYFLIRKYADVVLAVSESTAQSLSKVSISKDKIKSVACGVNYNEIRNVIFSIDEKIYDAIFMKHFSGTKGVFDVIEIWDKVVDAKPNAKLGLIGSGAERAFEKLEQMITEKKLKDNIEIIGPVYDFKKKFSILAKSKLFLLPSYEENWAIVIGEAMAAGLPVICYDLPEIRPIWRDHVIWVPKGNIKAFANAVVELLNNTERRNVMSKEGIEFVKRYDWEKIAEEELKFILKGELGGSKPYKVI